MASRTAYIFGLQVIKEDTDGTFKTPTKPLCMQKDSDMGETSFETQECNQMSAYMGGSYDVVLDGTNPKATIPIKQPLPLVLGGIEDILLSARLKKTTETSPDRTVYSPDSANSTGLSTKLTALRESWTGKGGKAEFKISGEVGKWIEFEATIHTAQTGRTTLQESANDNTIPSLAINGATGTLYYKQDEPILVNGNPASMKSFSFNSGVEFAESENDTDGKISVISDFKSELELKYDVKNDLVFKQSDVVAGTEFNIVIPMCDNTGTKKAYITIGKAVLKDEPKFSNQNGYQEGAVTLSCKKTSGDDNYSINFLS